MRILNRYILREFLRLFFLVLSVFVCIYLLVDFFEKVDDFLEVGLPSETIGRYFLYKIPLIVTQMEPVAVLLGGVLTISVLVRNNEMLAMKSIGMNLLVTCRPVFLAALVLSVLLFNVRESVVPLVSATTNYIWDVQVKHKKTRGFFGKDKFWFKGENAVYSVGSLNPKDGILQDVAVFLFDKTFTPREIIYAHKATWTKTGWLFVNGRRKEHTSDGSYRVSSFDREIAGLAENPWDFMEMTKKTDEMTLDELSAYIRKLERQGEDARLYSVEYQGRLAYALIGPVLLVLGIPAMLWRRVKSSIAMGISLGIVLVFIVWVTWHFSLTLGRTGLLCPFLAAWSPLLVAVALGAAGWRAVWQ